MRRTMSLLVIGFFVLSLGLSRPAGAVGFEDSLDDCSYPKVFDVLVLRPLSIYALMLGTLAYVPLGPLAWATVGDEREQIRASLIGAPARFAFKRPLGECSGVSIAY